MRIEVAASIGLTLAGFAACTSFSASAQDDAGSPEAGAGDVAIEAAAPDAAADPYSAAILADSPLAYWRMAITSGLTVPDVTGRDNPLILQGAGYTLGVPGATTGGDKAIRFDGLTASAVAADARVFDFPAHAPFTIECWARYEPVDGGTTYPTLISAVEGYNASANGYLLYITAGGTVQFNYGGAATVTAALPTTGGFHHYAATYDGTTSALYVDGQKSSKTTASDGVARTTSFSVGARSDGNEKFPGAIDEVAVYGRVLTPLELVKHIEAR